MPPAGWGGIVEEAPEPPAPLQGKLSVPTPSVAPYPLREFTQEEQAFFDNAWTAFKQGDPAWGELRQRWWDMGPEATGLLAENVYRALVASRVQGALGLVEEAKKELVFMGEGAVPVLVGALAVRAVRTADGREVTVGQEVLHDAAEAVSVIGAPAVPGLLDIVRSGEPSLVKESLWALGNIADPRAEETIETLTTDPNSFVRSAAVLALRRYDTDPARARMVAALEDADSLVVERGAQALATGRQAAALPAVVDVLERAVREGKGLTVRACEFALQSITGEKGDHDSAGWRRVIGRK